MIACSLSEGSSTSKAGPDWPEIRSQFALLGELRLGYCAVQKAGNMTEMPPPVVVALERDLFFGVRIQDVARAYGAHLETVEDADALGRALECWPELVLIDLAATTGWEAVVWRAKHSPYIRSIPFVAFGSHVDTGALRAARAAGCDHAWARSRFVTELPRLVQSALYPPTRWVEGWDEPPQPGLFRGLDQFNSGEYWDCHETLELLWRAEPRPLRDLYQGILQVGVAFYHLGRCNYSGALKMLGRGLPRLRDLPETCQRVAVKELFVAAKAVGVRIVALGARGVGEFDLDSLPRVRMVEPP